MDVKAIKYLATNYSTQELQNFANEIEAGKLPVFPYSKEDPGQLLSDVIQAAEVRSLVDQGWDLQEAVRAFSKRVRETLS